MDEHKKACPLVQCPQYEVEVACKDEEHHMKENNFEHFQRACDQKFSEILQSSVTAIDETRHIAQNSLTVPIVQSMTSRVK